MKRTVSALSLFITLFCSYSFAQTKVIKINATKANDYGIQYVLPKTVLTITVEYSQTQKTAGPYAKYASRYLGIPDSDVTMKNQMDYTLEKISVTEKGIPNKDQSYLVLFKPKTTAPFVYLTEEGLLCTINAEYQPEGTPVSTEKTHATATVPDVPKLNPQSIYTEEYLRAGSVSKMAEVAAKNIYRIRESRQDLLTGEVDNVPKDGEAMKIILGNLDAQEKLWAELFIGTSETRHFSKEWVVEPVAETTKEILFRFSKYVGVVDVNDLSGIPVYWNIKDLKTVDIPIPDPKKKAKEPQSIVYNIPGKAEIEIYTANQKMGATTVNVTQFGTSEILATELLEDKKGPLQIYFYPNTGAIRQIIQ
ncbi:MAG: DUF4831 family protein [Dysgonamonadaceae bacterium]|jgi:hypothetical protein|nr:DUF4831 family protein [Dysgonamonadaceae bacterium]